MRITLIFILFIAALTNIFSQTASIKGNVYDKETGEAIIYAVVSLEGTKWKTTTDLNGFFVLNKIEPGEYTLKVSYIGYNNHLEKINIEKGKSYYKKIFISPQSVMLNTVDIVAYKERRKTETRISKLEITQEQLKAMPSIGGEADVVQYLQMIPGIISTGDQGGQLYIRGGSPVQNRINLDGLTIINPFHSIGAFSVFETETISNVDVLTGGFNADNGGRISAIVNISTRSGNKKRFSGMAGVNPFLAKAIFEGPVVKLKEGDHFSSSFIIAAKKSLIDQTSKSLYTYIESRDSAGLPYSFQDLYAKLSLDLGKGSEINLFGFNFNDDYFNPKVQGLNWSNAGGGIKFRVIPGSSSLLIDALFGYSKYTTGITDPGNNNNRYSQLRDFTGKFDFSYFNNSFTAKYGLEFNTIHTDFTFDNIFKQTIREFQNTTNLSAYAKIRKQWGNLIVEPGLRSNYYASAGKISLEPRFSFKYNISPSLRLKGAAGKYTQNIISTTNDKDVVNYFIGFVSSPEESVYSYLENDLIRNKLQKASHLVLGVEYDILDNLEFNVEGYLKNFDQLVVINRNKKYVEDPNYVVETGQAYGLDITTKYELRNLYFWLTYSLGYVDRNDGEQVYPTVFDRRHNANLFINYNFGNDYSWQLGIRWNVGSGFPFTKTQGFYNRILFDDGIDTDYKTTNPDNIGIIYSSTRNGGRLPYYHRLDISLQKTVKFGRHTKAEITASVINVYNRENIFYFDRIKYTRVNQLPILPALGLQFYF